MTKQDSTNARTPAKTPYDMLGGDEGVRKLCAAFYRIMDTSDQTRELRAMHGEDLSNIEELLGDYLTTWLGGPRIWIEKKGGMCLTGAHARSRSAPKPATSGSTAWNRRWKRSTPPKSSALSSRPLSPASPTW